MSLKKYFIVILIVVFSQTALAQKLNSYKADFSAPKSIQGYKLIWNDEFNKNGKPDEANWRYEKGFVRNKELQWYQADNAKFINGLLVIEGRRSR